jgi:tetratricopeptide (TPR) repeat protein
MFWILLPQNVRTFGRRCGLVTGLLFLAAPSVGAQQQPDAATVQRHAREGERALADGRYADAQNAYEALRQLTPATAEVHARLGLIYFQQHKFTEAIPPLREALRLKPTLPKVDALLAMSLSELGRYNEALAGVKKAFAQSADAALRRMAGLHLQRIYTGLGRDSDAVDAALRMTRLYPDDPEVLYHSGRVFANFAYLQTMKLASVAPDSVWLHQAAGEANESQALYDAAIREYQQVIVAAPRRPGIRFRLGRVLLARAKADPVSTDLAAARKAFEDELTVDPTNANAAYELGEMDRTAGDFQSARQRFEQALSHDAAFDHALVGLGRTLIALERPAEALKPLHAALKINPQSDVAFYQIALAYRALGNDAAQERALADFNRVRSLALQRKGAIPATLRDVTPQIVDSKSPR